MCSVYILFLVYVLFCHITHTHTDNVAFQRISYVTIKYNIIDISI